jgi:eukaryotic-like serine/threonine-protein kinase
MPLTTGTRIGAYEILGSLGAGGMGEVYRARDARLQRDVAVKVLPEVFAADSERLARFTREAQTLAALNHPHIAQIHGLEESAGLRGLVMELIDGEDLSAIVARGPLPPDEALPMARQIAEALEAAHDAGIIHRDLKPANIKVRADGTVKVLDFGLAKAFLPNADSGDLDAMRSPTLTARATAMGVILGTAAYMAPEQAKGKEVDRRADIWAFGCVLYEMLAGRPVFGGETVTDVLAAVVMCDPDWSALPLDTPPAVRRLLERCLTRDPKRRLRDAGEARIALDETGPDAPAPPWHARRHARPRATTAAVGIALTIVAAAAGWWAGARSSPAPHARPLHLQLDPRPAAPFGRSSLAAFAFTPDGRSIVFAGAEGAGRRLYRRVLDQTEAAAIAGTEGGAAPFISPDGGWIGFWAGGALKKVPVGGGAAETLHDLRATAFADAVAMGWSNELGSVTDLFYGAAWLADDRIVYGRFAGGLWAIPSSGGAPRRLTDTDEGELAHRMPRALPGGGAILFTVQASLLGELTAIDALVLDTGERRRLVERGSDARYAAGHLLFAREGALFAVGFDPASLAVHGEPFRVLPDLMHAVHGNSPGVSSGAAQFDLSADGMLAFLPGGPLWAGTVDLGWVERGGRIERLDVRPMSYLAPKVSPDGRRLAVAGKSGTEAANAVYTIDLARGIPTMIARDAVFPLWTPDGTRLIAALRQATGRQEIYAIPLAEAGEPSRIAGSRFPLFPGSISADGRWLAYVESNPATGNDIWVVGLDPAAEPRPVVQTSANEGYPAFSPDGAWLAYSSTEGGVAEVYVQPFPGPGRREQVSSGGGISPVWAPDGRSIHYLDPARGRALVVPVTPGTPLQFGQPAVFADGAFRGATPVGALDIARDGRRLLVTVPGADPGPPPRPHDGQLHVIVNWTASFAR